jgi:hypothetical protein
MTPEAIEASSLLIEVNERLLSAAQLSEAEARSAAETHASLMAKKRRLLIQ